MKTLVLDTSTNYLVVGLLNGTTETFKTRIGHNDNSAYLISKIDELLKETKVKIDEIDQIVVGIGPGSYTGLRVSVVAAKALSFTKNIKLMKISSLAFLTSGYEEEVTASIDARRSHSFSGTYFKGKEVNPDRYIKNEKLAILNNVVVLSEATIKIDINNIIINAKEVKDIHALEPNYLRKTEAEVNYDQKNDN